VTPKVTPLALFNGLYQAIFNRLALAAEVWDGVAFVDQSSQIDESKTGILSVCADSE